jgi:hypothetical protein
VLSTLARRIMSMSSPAVAAIDTALGSEQTPGLRLRAALAVLELGPDLMDRADILARLEALERARDEERN